MAQFDKAPLDGGSISDRHASVMMNAAFNGMRHIWRIQRRLFRVKTLKAHFHVGVCKKLQPGHQQEKKKYFKIKTISIIDSKLFNRSLLLTYRFVLGIIWHNTNLTTIIIIIVIYNIYKLSNVCNRSQT